MKRRHFLVGVGAALACPSIGLAEATRTLRVVPYANVSSIDPIATSAYFARNHGFMVYDTLYGWNDRLEPEPQMAAGHYGGGRREAGHRHSQVRAFNSTMASLSVPLMRLSA